MKKRKRSFWIKLSVAAIALVIAVSIIAGTSYASNNQPFLGDCLEYGIVCNYFNQTGDVESNFAAGKYQGNGHTVGNSVSSDKANAPGVIKVGEVVDSISVRYDPLIVKDEKVKEEVKSMLASVENYSKSVVKKCDLKAPAKVEDQNNYYIDISSYQEDLVYVSADNLIEHINQGRIQNGALKIKLRADQTIVMNVTEKDKVTIPRYSLEVVKGTKTKVEIAETVIWNMPYVNNLSIASDNMQATIIAPRAFVNIDVTGEGWLVCDTIVSTNGEWHMISKKLPEKTKEPTVTPTEETTATPTEKPTATPTEKPTATPTEEPTATPTEEPTATPTEEPTATPIESPTASPTEEPTATPTKEPTASPTEKPTATPTEKPVVTPSPTPSTGDLEITKIIKGVITKEEAEDTLAFLITNKTSGEKKILKLKDFDYSKSKDKYTYILNKVTTGNYIVQETIADVDNLVLADVQTSVNGEAAIAGKTVETTVVTDKKTTVDYVNTYEPEKGNLLLTKTIEGSLSKEEAETSISFEITNDVTGDKEVKSLKDFTYSEEDKCYVLFIRDAVGSYTIKETVVDVDGIELASVQYKVGSEEMKTGKEASATVEKDKTTVVTYKNKYETISTPSPIPTEGPTATPAESPTATPAESPTATPTETPTATPAESPTAAPTENLTATPAESPTATPTESPTEEPTATPTESPTAAPTESPTATPPENPTATPAESPTATPPENPTATPAESPTATPSVENGEPTPTPTALTIIDEDTPLATKELDEPETPKASTATKKKKKSDKTLILDEDVPLSDSAPETGDTTNLLFPILVMGLSLVAIVVVLFIRRKRS